MGANIVLNSVDHIESPTIVLSTRAGRKHGAIQTSNFKFQDTLTGAPTEIYFDIYKEINAQTNWDLISDLKLVWYKEMDLWFEIQVETEDAESLVKHVIGKALCESELSQLNLYNIEINTETDILRDDYVEPTVFYDPEHSERSLLDRIMEKAPNYTYVHVDSTLMNIQRTFTFDNTSIYDAYGSISEEIGCLFVLNSRSGDDGKPARTISVYDLKANCLDCGYRGEFSDTCPECGSTNILTGYGDDTNIFISSENLSDDIRYQVDVGKVKNCFKLVAGDDIMTATVRNCNPNGSDYIWYISDAMRQDMSDALVAKLEDYDGLYDYYKRDYEITLDQASVSRYNDLVAKYLYYKSDLNQIVLPIVGYPNLMNTYYDTIDFNVFLQTSMMPGVTVTNSTAAIEAAKINGTTMPYAAVLNTTGLSATTANNAVLICARTLINPGYQVKVKSSTLVGLTWQGVLTVTSYSNSEDTADTISFSVSITSDFATYTEQQIRRALSNVTEVPDIVALFKMSYADFCDEIEKYSLDNLNYINLACEGALNVLIESGASSTTSAIYTTLYTPYYQKSTALRNEIALRTLEISYIVGRYDSYGGLVEPGIQNYIINERNEIQNSLNFEEYLGSDLWSEFCSYRREDKFANNNYISDGLNNAELFQKALEFIDVANDEIYKSAVLQHSISCSLKDLLRINQYQGRVHNFGVGNWMRLKTDGNVYKLRLLHYEIDGENLDNITVEFSDIVKTRSGVSDLQSILDKASNMASSYGAVMHQAEQGQSSDRQISEWVTKGLALTNMKIVSGSENQEINWDDNGFYLKEYIPVTDSYSDEQVKIINKGLYFTDDNWLTARAGIGKFAFFDPRDGKEKESFGVIADTIVSNILLSEEVGIYTSQNNIQLNQNGIRVANVDNRIGQALISEQSVNRVLVLSSEASRFSVGNLVSIGTTALQDNIAKRRAVTSIVATSTPVTGTASESYIYFDGASVNITAGDFITNALVSVAIDPSNSDGVFVIENNRVGKIVWVDNAGNAHFNGNLDGATGTFSGELRVGGTAQNPTFMVDTNGNLTATSGTIGGFELTTNNTRPMMEVYMKPGSTEWQMSTKAEAETLSSYVKIQMGPGADTIIHSGGYVGQGLLNMQRVENGDWTTVFGVTPGSVVYSQTSGIYPQVVANSYWSEGYGGVYDASFTAENGNFVAVRGDYIGGNSNTTVSDRRKKLDIDYDMKKYESMFTDLQAAHFKLVTGRSGRTHLGFIAQDVIDAAEKHSINLDSFAPIVRLGGNDGEEAVYGIRYGEFISLNTHMIQKLMKRCDTLERKIALLEDGKE